MNDPELLTRIRKILIEQFELSEGDLAPGASLYEDLGLDSLDSVDLIAALEKEFGFRVDRTEDESRIGAIRTITDTAEFIRHKAEPTCDTLAGESN